MKKLMRDISFGLSIIVVSPFLLLSWMGYRLGSGGGFVGSSQTLSLIPGLPGMIFRNAFYSLTLAKCPRQCLIDFGTIFPRPGVKIGRNVYIGAYCIIAEAIIGNDVLIGSGVHLLGKGTHDFSRLDIPIRLQGGHYEPVTIGEDSWLGNRVIVMADVGKKCIIGAGSVVTKAIPDYAIAVGNPARVVKMRNSAESALIPTGNSNV